MHRSIWVILGIGLIASGCGYRFAGGGTFPGGIKSVFVEILENKTAEVGIESTFTNDLIYEITLTGNVRLVSLDRAQGVLSGAITQLSIQTISRKDQKEAAERRLTVFVDLKLTDKNGGIVWSGNGIAASEAYPVDDQSKELTDKNKREAFEKLSKRLAEVINNRLLSDF